MQDYLNTALSAEERAESLLAQMTPEEKFAQTQCYSLVNSMGKDVKEVYPYGVGGVSSLVALGPEDENGVAAMIRGLQEKIMDSSRFRIPAIFHVETLCGVLASGAEVIPGGISQASTWDVELQRQAAQMIGRQGRALGFSQAFAPVLDICRNPRFGRIGETYGEDPTLAAAMGTAYVKGIRMDGRLEEGMMATGKHFLGFMAGEAGVHSARTPIPERELREVYAKSFQAAIRDGGLGGMMNSYGTIDGEAVCTSKRILTGLLREEMGFQGLTVSDYGAIGNVYRLQKQAESQADAGQAAMEAGMDIECPYKEAYDEELLLRFRNGEADMAVLDRAVKRILTAKFALGLFERPYPEEEQLKELFHTEQSFRIAGKLTRESLILLKNENQALPMEGGRKKIAVIGHHGKSLISMFGGYTGMAMKENMLGVTITMAGISAETLEQAASLQKREEIYPGSYVKVENAQADDLVRKCYPGIPTLLDALRERCPQAQIDYAYGYPYAGVEESGWEEALALAEGAEIVICTLGGRYGWNTASTTGEEVDSMNIGLPPCQEGFLKKLGERKKPGQTIIGVHYDGRPCSSDQADQVCDALLEAWAPAKQGAEAIVDVLTGKFNPCGRLPVSVALNAGQIPVYYAQEHNTGANHTTGSYPGYQDGPHEPRYPFGYGLSYTSFAYSDLQMKKSELTAEENLEVSLTVTNTGRRSGTEVVQMYVSDLAASLMRPVMELAGFARIELEPRESRRIHFTMPLSQMAFLDKNRRWKIEKGRMEVKIGASSADLRLREEFEITSDAWIEGRDRSLVAETF